MRPLLRTLLSALSAVLLSTGLSGASMAADAVGVRTVEVPAPSRGGTLTVTVWYPATAGGTKALVGEDRLFRGTAAWRDAPPAAGRFPLVLVSHGSGGSILNLSWLASRLAAAGMIVAGPNHPGTTRGNSTPLDTTRMWQRTADISDVLTALTTEPPWKEHIDDRHVGAIGFSLGGHTVLSLAGARADLEAYAVYCERYPAMPDCRWFASGGVDLRSTDKARFEQSNRDARIGSVVAVDPSVARAFTADSLEAIAVPVHIINLGSPGTIPVAVEAETLAAAIPDHTYQEVDGAVHLSFLAECQPGAREFLKETGDTDPLCEDAPGHPRTRDDIHRQVAAMIEAAFLQDFAR